MFGVIVVYGCLNGRLLGIDWGYVVQVLAGTAVGYVCTGGGTGPGWGGGGGGDLASSLPGLLCKKVKDMGHVFK